MIRSATKQDISDIRHIYKKCFDASVEYIDFFLKKCTPNTLLFTNKTVSCFGSANHEHIIHL